MSGVIAMPGARGTVAIVVAAVLPDAKPGDKQFVAAARDDHDDAIAWIRPWGQGRVFYN